MKIDEIKDYIRLHLENWAYEDSEDNFLLIDNSTNEIIIDFDKNLEQVKVTSWIYELDELKHLNKIIECFYD